MDRESLKQSRKCKRRNHYFATIKSFQLRTKGIGNDGALDVTLWAVVRGFFQSL